MKLGVDESQQRLVYVVRLFPECDIHVFEDLDTALEYCKGWIEGEWYNVNSFEISKKYMIPAEVFTLKGEKA